MLSSDDGGRRSSNQKTDRNAIVHAFLGASVLVTALLLPHARLLPIGSGIVLAGLIRWCWLRITS